MVGANVRLNYLVVLSIVGAAAGASAQDLRARIDSYLVEQVRTSGIPGLTAAVVRDGNVIYIGAFGVRPKRAHPAALDRT